VESGNHIEDDNIENYFDMDELRMDPYPLFRQLRSRAPYYLHGQWLISRHADVLAVLSDPSCAYPGRLPQYGPDHKDWEAVVSSPSDDLIQTIRHKTAEISRLGIFGRNPPDSSRLRTLMRTSLTRQKIAALGLRAQAIADQLLEKLNGASKFDVVSDFAFPLPLRVITEVLGVPANPPLMRRWARDLSSSLAADQIPIDKERGIMALSAMAEFFRKATPTKGSMLEYLREASNRGEISRDEILANCAAILVSGHITTQHLIASGIYLLLKHRQYQLLRDNPHLIGNAVEEMLRYEAPLQRVRRVLRADVSINGFVIPEGQSLMLLIGAANRDPALVADPERFDITREPVQHLTFAFGTHFCLGAALARIEANIALRSFVRNFPRLKLESEVPRWEARTLFRGLESLPVVVE